MEQICGYKGLDNQFYETEKECILADKKYKLKELYDKLNKIPDRLSDVLLHKYRNTERLHEYYMHKEDIMQTIAETVLRDSDKFIEIVNQKKALEVDLDSLEKEIEQHKKPWWLKTIWWK